MRESKGSSRNFINRGENMNIFLSGGSGGIGSEIIKSFSADSDTVIYFTYCHNASKAGSLQKDYPNARGLRCDFSSRDGLLGLISKCSDIEFDVIINNAFSKIILEKFYATDWEKIQEVIDVGVRSAFKLTQALSWSMKKRKKGHIINILSSVTLGDPPAQVIPYVMAKYALWGFHNALAAELTKTGIHVNAISPHMTETAFLSELPEHYIALIKDSLPGKELLKPCEIAAMAKYLVSNQINGVNVPIMSARS